MRTSAEPINRITVGDKIKLFGYIFELNENIIDSKDSRLIITMLTDTVRKYNLFNTIEEKENVVPFTLDFDICFITAKNEICGRYNEA